jgi:serine/threonine-protein kinase RsbT
VADEIRKVIHADTDVVAARQQGRQVAAECGFSAGDQTVIAAAISELARNILQYAKHGEIIVRHLQQGERHGVQIIAEDSGPGIRDINRALQDGYSTSGGLGLGLPGAKRLMDEFDIVSEDGHGTRIVMKKWRD